MPRLLFISLPLRGHLDWGGMMATATHLAGQPDFTVAWASGPAVAPALAATDIAFLPLQATGWQPLPPLPPRLSPAERERLRRQRSLDAWLDPAVVLPAAAELRQLLAAWHPDLVLVEPYAVAAALAAEQAGTPLVVLGRPALPPAAPTAAGMRAAALCQQAGVAGQYWILPLGQIASPWLHLDFFTREWYADLPAVASPTQFVGSAPAPPRAPSTPPTILITLGTLFNQDPAFFRIAADAVRQEGGQPLVVTGHAAPPASLPEGTEVRAWVDFAATLPTITGIIHHGGVGVTHAALRYGVPQVAVPHAGDQQPQAGRITQAQVGYGVQPAQFTRTSARWFARQLLHDDALHARARAWQAELAALGGPSVAAAAIRALLTRG